MSPQPLFLAYWNELQNLRDRNRIRPEKVTVDGQSLGVPAIVATARFGIGLRVDPERYSKIEESSAELHNLLQKGLIIYGVNTGVGSSASSRPNAGHDVQESIMQLLSCGILGDEDPNTAVRPIDECGHVKSMPQAWVRASMAIRVNSFAHGASGVRYTVVESLAKAVNLDLVPLVPLRGSMSASRDLSPLSYIASMLQGKTGSRVYIGKGDARRIVSGDEALSSAGIKPISLLPKEGLAIVNGTAVSSAVGALAMFEAQSLMATAQVLTAMAVESLAGSIESFNPLFAQLRPHPGQVEVAQNLRRFLHGTSMGFSHGQSQEKQQDRYSIRTASQWLGPILEDLNLSGTQVQIELNSVTDNPLVTSETGALHGGNFQAKAITNTVEKIRQACDSIGHLLFTQCTELMNPHTNQGLPPNLVVDEPNESYLWKGADIMIAALASELGFLANPVSSYVKPAEQGNQAVNSLALISGRYTLTALEVLTQISAVHILACCQAMDLRAMDFQFTTTLASPFVATTAYGFAALLEAHIDQQKLCAHLWQMFQTFWTEHKSMNTEARIVAASDLLDATVLKHCNKATETVEALERFKSSTTRLAIETHTKTRESYMMRPDATPFLGMASTRMYRFVRGKLNIPFVDERYLREAARSKSGDEGAKSGKRFRSFGDMITEVYRSIKSTELYGVVAECHAMVAEQRQSGAVQKSKL